MASLQTPATNPEAPVHVKITVQGKDETRKFKVSIKDCSAIAFPAKLGQLLQLVPTQGAKYERYSDSSASFVHLDSENASVYKQLYRAAKAKGKLRIRATITDDLLPSTQKPSASKAAPEQKPKSISYVQPYVSDLAAGEHAPSARLSTLLDLKMASEATPTSPEAPPASQAGAISEGKLTSTSAHHWPVSDSPQWSEPAKSAFKKAAANSDAPLKARFPTRAASSTAPNKAEKNVAFVPPISARAANRAESLGPKKEAESAPKAQTTALADLHPFTICCNSCDSSIPNVHWHCSLCDDGDYDLCEECVERGCLCKNEGHWLIKRTVEKGLVVYSKTETMSPKTPAQPKVDIAAQRPVLTSVPVALAPERTCNQCVQVLSESLFVTCKNCEDFDLCVPCHLAAKHGHHPNHQFAPVSAKINLSTTAMDMLAPGRNVRHCAICDGCEKDIHGVRFKCLTCPDWDFCRDCHKDADSAHPGHSFVPLFEPINAKCQALPKHTGILCDGELCRGKKSHIVGDRYKCTVCNDTDFCASCEALPLTAHNRTHPLIKFKTPVRNVTVSTYSGKTDASSLTTLGDQLPTMRSKSTETNAPASSANAATQVQVVAEVKPLNSVPEKGAASSSKQTVAIGKERNPNEDLNAHFLKDLVADGSEIASGAKFTQSWYLSNPGPHDWPAGCHVNYIGGDQMLDIDSDHPAHITQIRSAMKTNATDKVVKVGEEAEFKILLRAPERPGKAVSYWRLKTPSGHPFGHKLWCDINVQQVAKAAAAKSGEDEAANSKMIFPKLDKESPVSSIIAQEEAAPQTTTPIEDLVDMESLELDEAEVSSDEGFLTDEEYELVASGSEMEEAKNGKK